MADPQNTETTEQPSPRQPETPDATGSQATAPAAGKTTAPPTLAEQYELGDVGHDPDADPVETATVTAAPGGKAGESPSPPPPSPATSAAPAARPKHSRITLRQATDLGVPQELVDSSTPEQLDEYVYLLNRQRLEFSLERDRLGAADRPAGGKKEPGRAPAPAATPEEGEGDIDLGLDEEQYDPGLISAIKKVAGTLRQENRQLRQQVEALVTSERARVTETQNQTIDRLFRELGPTHEATFGRGSRLEVGAASPEFSRRMAVLALVERMTEGTLPERFQRAVTTLFGDGKAVAPAAAPAVPAAQPGLAERWAQGGTARPTHRTTAEPPGERKAVATAGRIMRENGLISDGDLSEDDFPG